MGEAKTVCPLCERKPGERHKKSCPKHKNYSISPKWRKMREKLHVKASHPIADIDNCVGGPIKTIKLRKGEPARVQL